MRLFLFICLFYSISASAQSTIKLDSSRVAAFGEEAKYKYRLLFDVVLNIIDDRQPLDDRYAARSFLLDLIDDSRTNIQDVINTPLPQIYKPSPYSFELLKVESGSPLYYKKFKLADTIIYDANKEDRIKYNSISGTLSETRSGYIYVAEQLMNTKSVDASIANDLSYNAYEQGLLKQFKFKLEVDYDDVLKMRIADISIINQQDVTYKPRLAEIEDNGIGWSDEAEKELVQDLVAEAALKGIELVPEGALDPVWTAEDTLAMDDLMVRDTTPYAPPTAIDYALPGLGQMKYYGRSRSSRVIRASLYGGAFIASAGYAAYSKIQSNKWYSAHIDSETFRVANLNYDKANRWHKHFVVGTGAAALVLVANAVDLKIRHSIQLRRINEAKGIDRSTLNMQLGFQDNGALGGSLSLNF